MKKETCCRGCNYRDNAPEGICNIKPASDGLPIRCVGSWAKDKYYYFGRYFDIFTASMRKKWNGELYYIDLFAGCGKCRVRETGEEIDGSALISLLIKHPFKGYFAVELNPIAADALKKRVENLSFKDRFLIIKGDCNKKIDEIIAKIPARSLSLAIIDPTGLHINFDTVKNLTNGRKIDLIITFPEGMDINRNLSRYLKQSHSILDDFIGDKNWRNLFSQNIKNMGQKHIEENLISYYKTKLTKLGYKEIKSGEILIRSHQSNLPLYYLLFASKHLLGPKFWGEISKISPTGQISMGFPQS